MRARSTDGWTERTHSFRKKREMNGAPAPLLDVADGWRWENPAEIRMGHQPSFPTQPFRRPIVHEGGWRLRRFVKDEHQRSTLFGASGCKVHGKSPDTITGSGYTPQASPGITQLQPARPEYADKFLSIPIEITPFAPRCPHYRRVMFFATWIVCCGVTIS